jgi:hypothetical protein
MLLLGVVGAVLWVQLAEPAQWEVRETGVVLTEAASHGQFSVIVTFMLVGVVLSLLWGAGVARAVPELGWALTPLAIVATSAAAVVAWRLGVAWGPPNPLSVRDAAVGERLPAALAVDIVAPFLLWPAGGLAGVLIGSALVPRSREHEPGPVATEA